MDTDFNIQGELDRYKYAIVGGILSVPFTVVLYLTVGDGQSMYLITLFFAGLLTSVYAKLKAADVKCARIGAGVGAVGSVAGLYPVNDLLVSLFDGGTVSWQTVAFLVFITCLLFTSGALLGWMGGKTGDWLTDQARSQSGEVLNS